MTAQNPAGSVYSEQFTLDGTPDVQPGSSSNQKIATLVIKNTNNAEAIGLRQTDNSLTNLNGTSETGTITYTVVNGKLLISNFS